jgi:HlyD family secretion protein
MKLSYWLKTREDNHPDKWNTDNTGRTDLRGFFPSAIICKISVISVLLSMVVNYKQKAFLFSIVCMVFLSCNRSDHGADAYGNFEAKEIIVSSEGNGQMRKFAVRLGQELSQGAQIGLIDTSQLHFSRKQLLAKKAALKTKLKSIESQLAVMKAEMKTIETEKNRIEKLFKDGAATKAQLDNIEGKMDVLNARTESVKVEKQTIYAEADALEAQISQVEDKIAKCKVLNPVKGTVLEKYVEAGEVVTMGKPLYKIANLDVMELKAYISGAQLPDVKVGQTVTVRIDKNEEEMTDMEGEVAWISGQAEFTPKIIQTKEMRVDLVYAFKVNVKNDGQIKIGMPGEVKF